MKQRNIILSSLRAQRSNPEYSLKTLGYHIANAPRNDVESGNALFFILIAIALLGLLTVTLSRSGDSSNDTGSYEQNQIAASEILSYAKSIENAVQQLLAKGCSENEISFEHLTATGYINPNSPADKSCHIFDVAGAGMTYRAPNNNWLDSNFSSNSTYGQINFSPSESIVGIGENRSELILFFNGLYFDICAQLNRQSNVTNPPNDVPNETVAGVAVLLPLHNNFKGAFPTTIHNPIGDGPGRYLEGKTTGCMKRTDASNMLQFYHVLHAR